MLKHPVPFEKLSGFANVDLSATHTAWQRSCEKILALPHLSTTLNNETMQDWQNACQQFKQHPPCNDQEFRQYLYNNFAIYPLQDQDKTQGLLTGYFQPEILVSSQKTKRFQVPIYQRPPELIVIENLGIFNAKAKGIRIAGTSEKGTLKPYFTRQKIAEGALAERGLELAWAEDAADVFFMHIQGSGRLAYEDGSILNISYDGTNGYPYTSIGKVLIDKGELSLATASMQTIKAWLRAHPHEIQDIFNHNESYVFFRPLLQHEGPEGALQTILVPQASLAVDPDHIPLGAMVWIDTTHPLDSLKPLQRLMVAQDVGGAIKGLLRGDFYWGIGEAAGQLAGPMKAQTKFYVLLPKSSSTA